MSTKQRVITRRAMLAGSVAGLALASSGAVAQQQFFRIGTGGTAGTYYPVGGMVANAVSSANIVATAVATNGSVANVNAIIGGGAESGFAQADVAAWAFTGTGLWEGRGKVEELRAIANLYPESVHLVVRKGLNVKTPADLKGRRVSLDEPGSGTLINARAILAAYGVREADIKPEFVKPNQAADKMKDGSIDAFFFTGGFPASAITELATSGPGIELVSIEGPQAEALRKSLTFFAADEIPAGTYKDIAAVKTVAVGAQWVTSSKISNDTVYEITKALWSDKTRTTLDSGHAKGKAIRKETALLGLGLPLHAGAERFYREAGLLK
ncbi:MAG: TAXI family TRAP transporter solute-binding subunit [Bosea sp. (in: a-proteobacteria)]